MGGRTPFKELHEGNRSKKVCRSDFPNHRANGK
jgi:hypothetical protein